MVGETDGNLVVVVNRRQDVLEALREASSKRRLVEQLDHSRSTVDRAVRKLDSLGLVTRDDGYRLTVTGRLVLELFQDFQADLDDVAGARELLAHVPPAAPMSPALLRDATVEVAEPPSPARALDPVLDLAERCDRMRVLAGAVSRPDAFGSLVTRRTGEGVSFEFVCSADVTRYVRREHRRAHESVHGMDSFELYRCESVPYSLGLVTVGDEHHTFVVVYDDDWSPQGVILNDALDAYAWAEYVYTSYREDAEPVELD